MATIEPTSAQLFVTMTISPKMSSPLPPLLKLLDAETSTIAAAGLATTARGRLLAARSANAAAEYLYTAAAPLPLTDGAVITTAAEPAAATEAPGMALTAARNATVLILALSEKKGKKKTPATHSTAAPLRLADWTAGQPHAPTIPTNTNTHPQGEGEREREGERGGRVAENKARE